MVVGQELPLWEVPAPSTKPANEVVKNRLGAFVYRWFRNPIHKGVLQIEDVRRCVCVCVLCVCVCVWGYPKALTRAAERSRLQWRLRSERSCRTAVGSCAVVTWAAGGC